ncbi:MAG: hypothetical protein AAF478_04365 [Pseudomonadota bacterium]
MAKGKKSRKLKSKSVAPEEAISGQMADVAQDSFASGSEYVTESDLIDPAAIDARKRSISEQAAYEAARDSESTPVRSSRYDGCNSKLVNSDLAKQAAIMLLIATIVGVLFGFAMLNLEGGREAVPAIGGMLDTQVPAQTASIVFFLDLLFPISFGAGFVLLASSLQAGSKQPAIRLLLTAVLVGITFDFLENALVFSTLTGEEPYVLRWPMTVLKYASLGFASVLLSAIMPRIGKLSSLVHLVTRYVFPVSIAALLSGLGGEQARDLIGASFPAALFLLALYARQLSKLN